MTGLFVFAGLLLVATAALAQTIYYAYLRPLMRGARWGLARP